MKRAPRLVLGVVLARWPHASAGNVCANMNWALAFKELGWEVWITEDVSSAELESPRAPGEESPQERFWKATAEEFGFLRNQCLLIDGRSPQLEEFRSFASTADLFINFAGHFRRFDLLGSHTVRAYLDVDPGFTQLWVEVFNSDMNLDNHDAFLTVGTTLNKPQALVPMLGREWIPVLPPVAADYWQQKLGRAPETSMQSPWTTIGHWYGYPAIEWRGRRYGGKRESLVQMISLPQELRKTCLIATDLMPEWHDYGPFTETGGHFLPSSQACDSVLAYLRFMAASRGEIGIAKEGYVVSRGGWMSDRSVVYLALGRPVVLQDTGWTGAIAPHDGMLVFRGIRDCAEAIRCIERDYERHSRAAESLARTLFSPAGVLEPLLTKIF